MTEAIVVRSPVPDQLLAEARLHPDTECCGLLAGREHVISTLLPATNALRSATAYEIAPAELFALFRRMRTGRLEHLGIYHSHLRGDNAPSPRDVELAFYPGVAQFIISPRPDAPKPVRAFLIAEGAWRELAIALG